MGGGSAIETVKGVAARNEAQRANGGSSGDVSGSETAGSKAGGSVRIGGRAITSRPSVLSEFLDEDLLKESLGEAQIMLG